MTLVGVHLLVRANDPLYELGFKIYTSRLEDKIWNYTLRQVASHFGVAEPEVVSAAVPVGKRCQWSEFGNVWKDSAVHTLFRRPEMTASDELAGGDSTSDSDFPLQ